VPALICFFLSDHFIQALSRLRPMVLVIALTLFGIYFLITKNYLGVFIVTFLYTYTNISSPVMLVYALVCEVTRFIHNREFSTKNLICGVSALLLGFLLHPHFPNNFYVFYLNMILVPFFAARTGILELGAEFFPISTRYFLLGYPLILLSLIMMISLGMHRRPKVPFKTVAFFNIASIYVIASMFSQRYIIHGYPIILLAFFSYLSDVYTGAVLSTKRKVLYAGVSLLLIISLSANMFSRLKMRFYNEVVYNTHFERMGRGMFKNIPAGELIFHTNWSDSQYFIGLNPGCDYFVTLDPVYMYAWDKQLYKLYRDVSFGRTGDPYPILKNIFKVKYGYAGKNYFGGLIRQIKNDRRFEILAEDPLGLIFKLTEWVHLYGPALGFYLGGGTSNI